MLSHSHRAAHAAARAGGGAIRRSRERAPERAGGPSVRSGPTAIGAARQMEFADSSWSWRTETCGLSNLLLSFFFFITDWISDPRTSVGEQ